MPILINETKAVEIIIQYVDSLDYSYDKVLQYLIDTNQLGDAVPRSILIETIRKANPDTLKQLLEII